MYESDKEGAKPNTFIYTAVVNAAAYTAGDVTEKQNAFRIADKHACRFGEFQLWQTKSCYVWCVHDRMSKFDPGRK
jgi:hypothetical protein